MTGKILVTGATGKVGRHIVAGLLERDADFRALARDPANASLPEAVEVVRGDLTDLASLRSALRDVETVFLLWMADDSHAPAAVEEVAKHAKRIVYLSSEGVRDDTGQGSDGILSSHARMESLIRNSGTEWTFLRPTGFASNTLGWAEDVKDDGIVRAPFGEAYRSLIHEKDIAAVAVVALTEDGHTGKTHIITGPEALSQSEQVRIIGEAIGRSVRWEEQSREEARTKMIEDWGSESVADDVLDAWEAMVEHPEQVTNGVEEITGRKALTFRKWAEDHATDFGREATAEEVAREYVSLFRSGDVEGSKLEEMFAADIVRVETAQPSGEVEELRGDQVAANMQKVMDEEEIHAVEIDGPFLGGDPGRFAVRFSFDSTLRRTDERKKYAKISLYTVKAGKISREEVYFDDAR